jgi:hypothetical protein
MIKESEQLWWDLIMTKDSARFYLTLPKGEWVEWAKGKIERMWEGVVVTEAEQEDLDLLRMAETTNVSRLSLSRHNMFSLAVDRREDTHPIGDVMGVIDDLKEGEKIRLAVKFDPVNRVRWYESVRSARERFNNGKMPQRGAAKPKDVGMQCLHIVMIFKVFGTEALALIFIFLDFARDILLFRIASTITLPVFRIVSTEVRSVSSLLRYSSISASWLSDIYAFMACIWCL